MAIKLVDELKAMGNFPIAHAEGINLVKTDGTEDNLQNLFDNGELGGGDSSVTLTQQEYEALSEEQKLDGLYYTYDTKRIFKNGVQYGASEPISLTMEEYKALKEAGAIDEQQEYLIEADSEGILLEASDISYSNAVSNLPCTTVQGAIDAVYDSAIKNKSLKTYTTLEQLGLADRCSVEDIYLALPDNSYFECGVFIGQTTSYNLYEILNVPYPNGLLTIRKYNSYRFSLEYKVSANGSSEPNELYIGQLQGSDGSGLTWSKVCTTTVEDVPLTNITIPNSMFATIADGAYVKYEVINGIAFLYFNLRGIKFAKTGDVGNLTIPKTRHAFNHTIISEDLKNGITVVGDGNNAQIWALGNTTYATHYLACISYPVAKD